MNEEDQVREDPAEQAEEQENEVCLEELSADELARLLQEAQQKADKHWDLAVRTQAEMDNLKKRHQRELEHAHKFGLEKFVAELLGVWDSLELGYHAAKENHDIEKLLEGTELTLKMLADAMGKFGVEQIDPQGQPFDPEMHQAMQVVERDDVPPNTVVEVIQKGYSLNGRLVRPALVMVSKAPS